MENITLSVENDIVLVRLTNGVTNAIGMALVNDLGEAVDQVKKECKGMVLAGGSKFFSIGFDLPGLLPEDQAGFTDFFVNFNRVVLKLSLYVADTDRERHYRPCRCRWKYSCVVHRLPVYGGWEKTNRAQ